MKYVHLFLFLVFFSSCASHYKLEKQPPVNIGDVYYQQTVGGREETFTEFKISIPVENTEVEFEKIYFREHVMPLKLENSNTYSVVFFFSKKSPDIIMSSNLLEEYGNTTKGGDPEFPFELADDEAVISYSEGKKTRFFKIEKMREKSTQYLPGQNR